VNKSVTLEGNPLQENRPDNKLNDYQHAKVLIQAYQRDIADYREMKQKEKQEGISDGRKRWFNRQIKDLRKKIQGLEEVISDEV
jgi:hypothetical protein